MNELEPFTGMKRAKKLLDNWFMNFPLVFSEGEERQPLVDIADKGKTIELTAELPGVKKGDIDLDIEEDSISISAESKSETEEKKKDYYFHERSYSSFKRTIPLPLEIVPGKAVAEFKDGILTVTMPKKHAHQKKKVKVKVK